MIMPWSSSQFTNNHFKEIIYHQFNAKGCLGHGDWNSSAQPELVEALLSVHVTAVACGPEHVVVVGSQGDVYAWGRGSEGRLGLGHEEDTYLPQVHLKFNILLF